MQLNKTLTAGNLTRDPEVRYTPKGIAVAEIGLASNRTWRTESGEQKEEVCFITVIAWGKQAESVGKYLKKGDPIFVEGRLKFESWEKNGEKRFTHKIEAERVHFLSYRKDDSRQADMPDDVQAPSRPAKPAGGGKAAQGAAPQNDLEDDEIPF